MEGARGGGGDALSPPGKASLNDIIKRMRCQIGKKERRRHIVRRLFCGRHSGCLEQKVGVEIAVTKFHFSCLRGNLIRSTRLFFTCVA